jgi:16S rRNA processing protein RimM
VVELADPVVIGVVTAPHGVRGTVRVRAVGSGRHLREGMEPVISGTRRRILKARATPKGVLVDLEGIESRAEAGELRGAELVLERSELDALGEGEFYVTDLIGLAATDEVGECAGEVVEVAGTPGHEVLVLRSGEEENYVPFTFEHVTEVDPGSGRVVVRIPEEE